MRYGHMSQPLMLMKSMACFKNILSKNLLLSHSPNLHILSIISASSSDLAPRMKECFVSAVGLEGIASTATGESPLRRQSNTVIVEKNMSCDRVIK